MQIGQVLLRPLWVAPRRRVAALLSGALLASLLAVSGVVTAGPAAAVTWSGTVSVSAPTTSYTVNDPPPQVTATASPTTLGGAQVVIYDSTVHLVGSCGANASCSTTGYAPDGTRQYRAYVLASGTTPPTSSYPTSGVLATSGSLTITSLGYVNQSISLTADTTRVTANDGPAHLTAHVYPPPIGGYTVSIYSGSALVAYNGISGTTYGPVGVYHPANSSKPYTAYVSYGTPPDPGPPPNPRAVSNSVTVSDVGWSGGVSIAHGDPSGGSILLVTSLTTPVAGGYQAGMYDATHHKVCTVPCTMAVGIPATGSTRYDAYVALDGPVDAYPSNDIRASAAIQVNSDGTVESLDPVYNSGGRTRPGAPARLARPTRSTPRPVPTTRT